MTVLFNRDVLVTKRLLPSLLLAGLAIAWSLMTSLTAHGDTSGETGMGYDWTDNQRPNPTVAFQWMDIAESGTRIDTLSDCDDCLEGNVPIGFEFSFYGDAYATVSINSNGVLQFVDTGAHWGPGRLPHHDFLGPAIFPLWGDWDPRSNGNLYVETLSNWPKTNQRAFIVQWDDVENWDCRGGNNATWQVVLLEDGGIIFQYLDTAVGDLDCNHGADMTIGVQQGFSECFVMYSHRFASVPDRTAIVWSPQPSNCNQSEPQPTAGDANCDGVINPLDATLVLQLAAGLIAALPCPQGGDANGDGVTNALDAQIILQFSAGLIDTLPP